MKDATDPVALLTRALDQTGDIVAQVRPDQAALPTPDEGWDVRTLVNHTVQDVQRFAVMVSGGDTWELPSADLIGDDWAGAYRRAADDLLTAWSQQNALEGAVQIPFGEVPAARVINQQIADVAVHGWDIAKATGQSTDLDPEVGQLSLDWAKENLKPELRGGERSAFGPEIPVPEDAPLYDRLAGFFGRDPAS